MNTTASQLGKRLADFKERCSQFFGNRNEVGLLILGGSGGEMDLVGRDLERSGGTRQDDDDR